MIQIPFATLNYVHSEIRDDLDKAYKKVLDAGWFIQGPECMAFEEEFASYVGTKYCIGVASGLDAITLILRAMNIGEGDEVILPSNTFIATVLAVSYCGATPVLTEPEIETFNLNPARFEEKITENTKAIIAVQLQGRPCDMDAICTIARKHGIKVIEDAAQAHGAKYKAKWLEILQTQRLSAFIQEKIWVDWEMAVVLPPITKKLQIGFVYLVIMVRTINITILKRESTAVWMSCRQHFYG